MTRSYGLLSLVGLLAAALVVPAPTAFGEPTGVNTVVERRIEAAEVPVGAEVSQSVLEFGPGAWTPLHSHGGASYNTVLAGEVTLRMDGVDRTFTAGDGWTDQPGVPHQAGNLGTTTAYLVATFVVPRDVPPSTILDLQDGQASRLDPTVVAAQKPNAVQLFGPTDVIQRFMTLQPGSTVPTLSERGQGMVSVLAGSVTASVDGATRNVSAGRGWVESADAAGGYTAGESGAHIVATTFVPSGRHASASVVDTGVPDQGS